MFWFFALTTLALFGLQQSAGSVVATHQADNFELGTWQSICRVQMGMYAVFLGIFSLVRTAENKRQGTQFPKYRNPMGARAFLTRLTKRTLLSSPRFRCAMPSVIAPDYVDCSRLHTRHVDTGGVSETETACAVRNIYRASKSVNSTPHSLLFVFLPHTC